MTPRERAEQMNREEWEAERADLMRRALAYAARKRQAEHARAVGVALLEERCSTTYGRHAARQGTRTKPAVLHTHAGQKKTLTEWAEIAGISYRALSQRMKQGRTLSAALAMPKGPGRWKRASTLDRPAEGQADRLDRPKGPGVPSDLGPLMGTGAGSTARETTNITFPQKAEAE